MQLRIGSLLACSYLLALGGCVSSEPVDLGHDDPKALGSALSDYEGSWEGYAEALTFDDGTDRVHLELDANGTGVLEVGEADPLPPPDPDHSYPPGGTDIYHPGAEGPLVPGFSYPVTDGSVAANRLRLRSNSQELYREWCELQTPYLTENTTPAYWACLPTAGYGTDQDENGNMVCTVGANNDIVVDCAKPVCLGACECTEDGCGLNKTYERPDVYIDAALEGGGDTFVGTLLLGSDPSNGARIIVHLVRQ